jgi:hypothetical protein
MCRLKFTHTLLPYIQATRLALTKINLQGSFSNSQYGSQQLQTVDLVNWHCGGRGSTLIAMKRLFVMP